MLNEFENLKKENAKLKKEITLLENDIISLKRSFQALSKNLDKAVLSVAILISEQNNSNRGNE